MEAHELILRLRAFERKRNDCKDKTLRAQLNNSVKLARNAVDLYLANYIEETRKSAQSKPDESGDYGPKEETDKLHEFAKGQVERIQFFNHVADLPNGVGVAGEVDGVEYVIHFIKK